MGLTAIDWAAIIGAAAWIPQIIGWVARKLTVPKVRLVASGAPEIGYTTYGPLFNLTCAISAERKDAIIERMTVRLEHEKGQVLNLTWSRLHELFSEIRGPEGTAEVGKNQQAIALKVGTLLLAERVIGFNDLSFQEQVRSVGAPAAEKLAFLRQSNESQDDTFRASKEYADLTGLWERRFSWQEGKYTATVRIHVLDVANETDVVLRFTLSTLDISRLRQNIVEVKRYQHDLVSDADVENRYQWQWIYPPFERT